ncbi:hypothetical protein CFOL_v3_05574, partial [Cephalotus follicularis]
QQRKKCEEDELLYREHILNTLSDRLFDLFTGMKFAKEIWDALEFKYRAEEQGTNRYLTTENYFDFKFVDTIPLLEEVNCNDLNSLSVPLNTIHAYIVLHCTVLNCIVLY